MYSSATKARHVSHLNHIGPCSHQPRAQPSQYMHAARGGTSRTRTMVTEIASLSTTLVHHCALLFGVVIRQGLFFPCIKKVPRPVKIYLSISRRTVVCVRTYDLNATILSLGIPSLRFESHNIDSLSRASPTRPSCCIYFLCSKMTDTTVHSSSCWYIITESELQSTRS